MLLRVAVCCFQSECKSSAAVGAAVVDVVVGVACLLLRCCLALSQVESVLLSDGNSLPADIVVVGAGARPASGLFKGPAGDRQGRGHHCGWPL